MYQEEVKSAIILLYLGILAGMDVRQLGLIERRGSRYQPVEVTGKKDLSSAPVLRRLAEGEG